MNIIKRRSRALLFCVTMTVVCICFWIAYEKGFGPIQFIEFTTPEVSTPMVDSTKSKVTQISAQSNPSPVQRCDYNGQSYVEGDITKTDNGWIRCTPTIVFTTNSPDSRHTGSAAWTLVQ